MSWTPLQVVCGVICHKGLVLATRRDPGRAFPLQWEFPGGKIEDGEDPAEALHRELEEELSLKVRIRKALEPVAYSSDGHHLVLLPFLCDPDQDTAPVPVDHPEVRWISPEASAGLDWVPADLPLVLQLPALTNPATMLPDHLQSGHSSL